MTHEELQDWTRLVLQQCMAMLASELAQLARCLRGERRRQVETLCSEARQMISAFD